jgi:hypothetical protein
LKVRPTTCGGNRQRYWGQKPHNRLLQISSQAFIGAVAVGWTPESGLSANNNHTKEHIYVWAIKKSGQQVIEVLVYAGL